MVWETALVGGRGGLVPSRDRKPTRIRRGGEQDHMTTITRFDQRPSAWAARGLVHAGLLLADMRVA
jgi:hypothetical protein